MTCLTEPKEGIREKHLRTPVTTADERDANRPHQLCLFGVILQVKWQLLRWPFLAALFFVTRSLLTFFTALTVCITILFLSPSLNCQPHEVRDHVVPVLNTVRSSSQFHKCAEGADGLLKARVANQPQVPRRLVVPQDLLSS